RPVGANLPIKAISAVGTATNSTAVNTGNVIDNNNIYDFFGTGASSTSGIDIRAGNTNWMVSNNRLFQTAPRVFTGATRRYSGITFSGTASASGDFLTIAGNTIGFGAANGTGTTTISGNDNEVRGIDLQGANSSTTTSVRGNTISAIDQTSSRSSGITGLASFTGIAVSASAGGSATGIFDIGTGTGNTIGSLEGSSTITVNATSATASTAPVFGILVQSSSSDNISNNKMGAITIQGSGTVTGFRGVFAGSTSTTTHTIGNNTIGGSTVSGGIVDAQVGNYAMYGIITSTAAATVTKNLVRNISGNSNGASLLIGAGIIVASTNTTNTSNISHNTVYGLSNASGSASNGLYGIQCNLPATANVVERNFVHSLTMTSSVASGQIGGIVSAASTATGTATYRNNFVRLGFDSVGNAITAGLLISGLWDSAGTSNFFFNSVYIGGSGVASASTTFAFNSQVSTNVRNYQNNILWNARSNASGGGKNYAVAVAGSSPNPTGLTSNFNDLYATGAGSIVGLFNSIDQPALADWKTATGQDVSSISGDPLFVAPNGTAAPSPDIPEAVVDLHISAGSPAIGAGVVILGITDDFDGGLRKLTTPDIGADEYLSPAVLLVTVSGRVFTPDGRGLRNAKVVLTDPHGMSRTITTSSFGFYKFDDVAAGESYVIGVISKQYRFASQLVQIDDTLTGLDFMGLE
ncbi:MAG: carboxypeptidase-like regulatory domain-containing protein, partial [Acidobacteriota bacterium]